jgi:hypothetical protein
MMCAMRRFENIDEGNVGNVKEWLQSDACELGFQHMTDTDIVCATKQKHEEEGGEDKSEIHTAVRSLKQSTCASKHYKIFLKINVSCVKKVK